MAANAVPAGPLSVAVLSRCSWTLLNFRRPLLEAMRGEGTRVLAVGDGRDEYRERLVASGIPFQHVAVSKRGLNPGRDLLLLWQLARLLRRVRPDVAHCFTIKMAIYGTLAAALAGVPIRVVTITGLGHAFTSAPNWLRRLVRVLYRTALSYAHLVQFQNSEDRDLFVAEQLVARAKTMLVPGSGVDLERFKPVVLPVTLARPPSFLMIARLLREKGVFEFMQAAQALKRDYPGVSFGLVGGQDPRNPSGLNAQEVEQLRQSTQVVWHSETADVRPYIEAADVVVLPSYREGLPRALVEAAAMGRPAIASDVPGCRDVVVDGVTGWLVAPRNSTALADAMRRMIEQPDEIVRMGAAARDRAVACFDERMVIGPTLREYRRLLAEGVGHA